MDALHCLGRVISLAIVCSIPVLSAPQLHSREALKLDVTPPVSMAPGHLTVRVNIESAAENRKLQIVAESPDFYRSSEVDLDGANAATLSVFEFRNLPTGTYEVTGTLVGVNGRRAMASALARVAPSPGAR